MRCKAQGKTRIATDLDHVIPLAKGGSDDESNWQGLCAPHHKDKTAEDFGKRPTRRIGLDGWPVDQARGAG